MAVLPIILYPDPRLKQVSEPVGEIDDALRATVQDLIETMHDSPGVGVAAPQCGVMLRLVVMDVTGKAEGNGLLIMINPEIVEMSEEKIVREGCLSIPEFTANVKRAQQVKTRFTELDGSVREIESAGLEAICIQHEMDHLNGILFLDRVVSLKKDLFRRKNYTPPPAAVEAASAAGLENSH
ncbi:MAG: peptide deformylase [Candidatus Xenobia bacterium]